MTTKTKPGLIKSTVQSLARWAGIPVDAGDGIAYALGDSRLTLTAAGQSVTPNSAMQLSAVWACVTLLADTISTLPLNLYQRTPDGRKPATDHPLYRVLHRQPNADQTSAQFWGAFVASMLLRDGGYAEKTLGGGRVVGLNFLRRDWLSIRRDTNGVHRYFYSDYGRIREIPESLIFRVPGFSLDGYNGCSAIQYGAKVFAGAQAAADAANSTFERGLMPTTVFKYPKVLKAEQRAEARAMIETLSGAVNAGKPIITEADMETGTLGINPADAQLLESRAFSVEEICSWFRVQPFMIGRASAGQTNWGTGIEQQMIGFITFTLAPWLRRLEQAILKDLISPSDKATFYAEFELAGLLRGDSAARREFYASALQNGWMNRAQVAQLENLPAPPGGDIYTVQSNLLPLDKLGAANDPAAIAARAALLAWLKSEEN